MKKEKVESAPDTELEIIELKELLREVEMEHDILKSEHGHDFAERQLVTVASATYYWAK